MKGCAINKILKTSLIAELLTASRRNLSDKRHRTGGVFEYVHRGFNGASFPIRCILVRASAINPNPAGVRMFTARKHLIRLRGTENPMARDPLNSAFVRLLNIAVPVCAGRVQEQGIGQGRSSDNARNGCDDRPFAHLRFFLNNRFVFVCHSPIIHSIQRRANLLCCSGGRGECCFVEG